MNEESQWLLCPVCHGETRVKIREDTVLHNFPLFCPKCKNEKLIDMNHFTMTLIHPSRKA